MVSVLESKAYKSFFFGFFVHLVSEFDSHFVIRVHKQVFIVSIEKRVDSAFFFLFLGDCHFFG
jgi:hypothetical protein